MKKIITHSKECTGCRVCESTCALYNERQNNPGKSRVKVVQDYALGISTPVLCYQCKRPPCAEACPVNAITRDEKAGVVRINYEECIGCELCVPKCPFGAIIPMDDKIIKCELCGGEPQCVKYCETKAIEWVEPRRNNQKDRIAAAEGTLAAIKQSCRLP